MSTRREISPSWRQFVEHATARSRGALLPSARPAGHLSGIRRRVFRHLHIRQGLGDAASFSLARRGRRASFCGLEPATLDQRLEAACRTVGVPLIA
jgi:hypothetical protein